MDSSYEMIRRTEMMKIILVGLRQEVIVNDQNKNFKQSLNNYISCMRDARKFGISVKEIIIFYKEINEIMAIKKASGDMNGLIFSFDYNQEAN
jgi:hypothetical protein